MKKNQNKILLAVFFIVLIAASAVFCSCKPKDEGEVLGTGNTSFRLEITGENGETKIYTVKTYEAAVGDALIKVGLVPADSKAAGIISTLNGITPDWEADQSYWGFYVNGEMYMDGGAFDVEIDKDAVYAFKYETWADFE